MISSIRTLTTPQDDRIIEENQIDIEIQSQEHCGVIVFKGRQFKVQLFTKDKDKQNVVSLSDEQLVNTALKVAVILFKKELFQVSQGTEGLHCTINQNGIFKNKECISHANSELSKDTTNDYHSIMSYLYPQPNPSSIQIKDEDEDSDEPNESEAPAKLEKPVTTPLKADPFQSTPMIYHDDGSLVSEDRPYIPLSLPKPASSNSTSDEQPTLSSTPTPKRSIVHKAKDMCISFFNFYETLTSG